MDTPEIPVKVSETTRDKGRLCKINYSNRSRQQQLIHIVSLLLSVYARGLSDRTDI